MDSFIRVVQIVGLANLLLVALIVGGYSLQLLVRLIRHWWEGSKKKPPASFRGSLFGLSWEIQESVENLTEKAERTLEQLDNRVKVLEQKEVRDILRELGERKRQLGKPRE